MSRSSRRGCRAGWCVGPCRSMWCRTTPSIVPIPTGTGGYILLLVYAGKNVNIAVTNGTEPCGAGQDVSHLILKIWQPGLTQWKPACTPVSTGLRPAWTAWKPANRSTESRRRKSWIYGLRDVSVIMGMNDGVLHTQIVMDAGTTTVQVRFGQMGPALRPAKRTATTL